MLGIDPSRSRWTLGELIAAYTAKQREDWEHTCALVASWTGKTVKNPYRRRTRPSLMHPSELHAMVRARGLHKRNS